MGLLRSLLTFPVSAPVQGTLWLGRKIGETAEQELNDPVALRAALAALEAQLLAGEITEEAYDTAEDDLLARLRALS